jgi:Flavodoxin domain
MPRRSPNGAEPRRTDHLESHSQTIDAEMRRERSKADPTAQRLGFTKAVPSKPHTPRSSLKGRLTGPRPAERAMCTYTSWGTLVMPAASLVDKGKPDVSRGRKATGPTRVSRAAEKGRLSCASPPSSSALSRLPAIEMSILVAYASRHVSAGQIAERIADGLMAAGNPANAPSLQEESDLADSSCLVFGSVVHSTHWLREAPAFASRNRDLLATTSAPMTWACGPRRRPTR